MSNWSLSELLKSLHEDIEHKLSTVRKTMAHPGAKGDSSESIWLELFNTYLPERYKADKAFVVDSKGVFSDQLDVVIFDRQYSPFVFNYKNQKIIPAESVYAVFEAKQTINLENIKYAQNKLESMRDLYRTSIAIPHIGGIHEPKPLTPIIGGILTLDSDWNPPLGEPLINSLEKNLDTGLINIGCVASHGYFFHNKITNHFDMLTEEKAATAFLFKLISELQLLGTVPMIDIQAYGKWLFKNP